MSSEANVALIILHHVGFIVVVELLFCAKELLVTTAITNPLVRQMAGPFLVEELFVQFDNDYQGRTCLVHDAEDEEGHLVGRE